MLPDLNIFGGKNGNLFGQQDNLYSICQHDDIDPATLMRSGSKHKLQRLTQDGAADWSWYQHLTGAECVGIGLEGRCNPQKSF